MRRYHRNLQKVNLILDLPKTHLSRDDDIVFIFYSDYY